MNTGLHILLLISLCSVLAYVIGHQRGVRKLKAAEWEKLIEQYRGEVARVRELAMDADRGTLAIAFDGPAIKIFAAEMVQWFKKEGGRNYVTLDLRDPPTGESYSITMQRAGGKTPAQDLRELKERLAMHGHEV
jgi:hypothetical protein